jgi:predicted deacylase
MRPFLTKRVVALVLILAVLGVSTVALVVLYKKIGELSNEGSRVGPKTEIIGSSVEGRAIEAYTYGDGERHLVFVGGMHGGYEWNSVLLAYRFLDYLGEHPDIIPGSLTVTVIPSANPDGVYRVVGKEGRFSAMDVSTDEDIVAEGRFNARGVDLNRNFDCKWKPEGTWRGRTVSAGSAPFSEPETLAIRDLVLRDHPDTVVFWHSQSNAVYASECEAGILSSTLDIMNAYARASGYSAVESFDAYEITGDAEGWLASIHIPAITVELSTHETVEWERNLAGIKALFSFFDEGLAR